MIVCQGCNVSDAFVFDWRVDLRRPPCKGRAGEVAASATHNNTRQPTAAAEASCASHKRRGAHYMTFFPGHTMSQIVHTCQKPPNNGHTQMASDDTQAGRSPAAVQRAFFAAQRPDWDPAGQGLKEGKELREERGARRERRDTGRLDLAGGAPHSRVAGDGRAGAGRRVESGLQRPTQRGQTHGQERQERGEIGRTGEKGAGCPQAKKEGRSGDGPTERSFRRGA